MDEQLHKRIKQFLWQEQHRLGETTEGGLLVVALLNEIAKLEKINNAR